MSRTIKAFDCPSYAGDTKLEACLNDEGPGERGPTVAKVQNELLKDGADLGEDGADGAYGAATGQAVMAFKIKHHLGFEQFPDVGPGTMAKLDELCAPSPIPPSPVPPSRGPQPTPPTCTPRPGITNDNCSAYVKNGWWLPVAYVNNATCACATTPNEPTANCVRQFLQDRLAVKPASLKALAVAQKILEGNPTTYFAYQAFVQAILTAQIYSDHVEAYRNCCCPSGPAAYPAWIGVTSTPIQPCSLVGLAIRYFGSCSGTPGQ